MSVKFTEAVLTPSTVNAGAKFLISVTVYDEDFEFEETATVRDIHQGFADEAQTVGGKLV